MSEIPRGILVGVGNPLLDILANVEDAFLEKYGLKSNDAILAGDAHKNLVPDIVKNFKVEYVAGGSVQNTLRIAQWVLTNQLDSKSNVSKSASPSEWITKTPGNFIFMGCIGTDENGQILKKVATDSGIDTKYQYNKETPTGTCAVLISHNGQHRSMVANLAAANCFTIDHIQEPENAKVIENAKYFYISGFFLTVSVDTALAIAKHTKEKKLTLLMNLSAPFIVQIYKKNMMACMPYIDVLFGNDLEAKAISESLDLGTSEPKEIALKLSQLEKIGPNQRMVIITQGDKPVLVAQGGTLKEYPVKVLKPEEIVDTNGAGDAFVGGFLAQLVQGRDLEASIKCGVWAATHVIQQSGCAYDPKLVYPE